MKPTIFYYINLLLLHGISKYKQMKILFFVFFFFSVGFCVAQPKKWDLNACVTYALTHNLETGLRQLSVLESQNRYREAKHSRYPNLNAFAGHSYNWGRSFDVFTNAPVTQRVRSNNFSINSSAIIFNGFRIKHTIKQAALAVESAEFALEKQKNDLVLGVVTAYVNVLFGKETCENAKRQKENTAAQLARTEKLVSAGVLPKSDLFNLKSQYANDDLRLVEQENNFALARLSLRQLLQIEKDETFELATPVLPDTLLTILPPEAEAVYTAAEATFPEVKNADLNVENADLGIKIAKSGFYPTLSASAGINTFYSSAQKEKWVQMPTGKKFSLPIGYFTNPTDKQQISVFADRPQMQWRKQTFSFGNQLRESLRENIGFSLSIPIYSRYQLRTKLANSKIGKQKAEINAQRIRNELQKASETAYFNVLAAQKTYRASQKKLAALAETFRLSAQKYNNGALNVTEYQLARNNFTNAKSDLIRAKYDLFFKQKVLDFYLGKKMTF